MAQGLRDVKRRIKSVQSTKKITRAMELIAASRVMKAQQRVRQARPYAEAITAALSDLASNAGAELHNSFLDPRTERRKAAVVVVSSDRGLAGAYSSSVLRQAEELFARLRNEGVEPVTYVTGRKGTAFYRFRRRNVAGSWVGFSDSPSYENAKEVADAVIDAYKNEEIDEIFIVYTQFVSSLVQRAVARRLLPLEVIDTVDAPATTYLPAYDYEPDIDTVLNQLVPRYIEARVFSAFLEASAAEQAARRRAMSQATENATGLIEQYTREYNQARQAAITQELMEVVGAAEAFNGS